MPFNCCILECKGNHKNGPSVSVFNFPRNEEIRTKWLLATGRKDCAKGAKVCEVHFKESDFETEISAYDSKTGKTLTAPLYRRRLKKDAVPSLFLNVSNSEKSLTREDPEEKRLRLENGQLLLALQQSLEDGAPKSDYLEDSSESTWSSENDHVKKRKQKGVKRKKNSKVETVSNEKENGTSCSSSTKDYPNNTQETTHEVTLDKSDMSNGSYPFQKIHVKVEKPWEKEYNYVEKPENESADSDTIKINEKSGKEMGSFGSALFSKSLKISEREESFGRLVACEMSDLCENPKLYLKTKQTILNTLVEAHFEQMSSVSSIDERLELSAAEEESDLNSTDHEDCDRGRLKKKLRRLSSSSISQDICLNREINAEDPPCVSSPVDKTQNERQGPYIIDVMKNRIDSPDVVDPFALSMQNITTHLNTHPEPSLNISSNLLNQTSDTESKTIAPTSPTAFERAILRELNIIKTYQRTLMENIQSIMKILKEHFNVPTSTEESSYNLIREVIKLLPLSNRKDLNQIEVTLIDDDAANQMVNFLKRIGGGNCEQAVKFMLRKLLTDEMAMDFSFLGLRGKLPFKPLKLCKVILDAVRSHVLWKDAYESNVERTISNWLRHARGRSQQKKIKFCK